MAWHIPYSWYILLFLGPHFSICIFLPLLGNWGCQSSACFQTGLRSERCWLIAEEIEQSMTGAWLQAIGGQGGKQGRSDVPSPCPVIQSERSAAESLQDWASKWGACKTRKIAKVWWGGETQALGMY